LIFCIAVQFSDILFVQVLIWQKYSTVYHWWTAYTVNDEFSNRLGYVG
jgi:hypothetical protein